MFHHHEKRAVSLVVFSAALFACASLMARPLYAQQPPRADATSAAERARQRQISRNDRLETELRINALERESRQPRTEESPRSANMKLKDDFEQLQTVNNQMMAMVFANNVLDYKRVSEAITEIRKRAAKLMSNLPLPPAEKDGPEEQPLKGLNELNQGEVKPALLSLDDLIQRFVTNPVFQQSQVVDIQQSSKARRDLEAILKLSEKIRKSTDKLMKTSSP
jgi:hypothetical protein